MHSRLIATLTLPAIGLAGSCPDEFSGPNAAVTGAPVVDERAGTVMNVALGESARKIRQGLGAPANRETRPVEEVGLPWFVEAPKAVPGDLRRPRSLAYADVDVLTAPGSGAYTISIWRKGVRTRRGVSIGDSLARARERYRRLTCDVRNRDSEYEPYPYCRGRVGGHQIWFGRDPIESITISLTALG